MASGNASKMMGVIAQIAMRDNGEVDAARTQMVGVIAQREILMDGASIRKNVDTDIGYLAGMFPPELGNRVLQVFNVTHPYFGSHIPEDARVAFEMGTKLNKEFVKQEQRAAEAAKKVAMVSELGVMLPESDETVSISDAHAILTAMHHKRGRKGIELKTAVATPEEESETDHTLPVDDDNYDPDL